MSGLGSGQWSLVEPGGLWLWCLALPLILVHLWRSQRRTQVTASLSLWRKLSGNPTSQIVRRKRWPEQLWPQLAALFLLGLGAAQPNLKLPSLAPRAVFVLDISASMQTREPDGQTRMDLAKRAALDWAARAPADTEIALITAGSVAKLSLGFTNDREQLARSLASSLPVDVEGALSDALDLARDQGERSQRPNELLVFTDGVSSGQEASSNAANEHVLRFGSSQPNTAIVQFEVQSVELVRSASTEPAEGFDVRALVTLKHFGLQPRQVQLTLHQRNVSEPLASSELWLSPGEERTASLNFRAAEGDQGSGVWAEIAPNDSLALDDRAYAVIPEHAKLHVAVIGERPSPWLIRALRADPEVELQLQTRDGGSEPSDQSSLVIYVDLCPHDAPEASFVVINPPEGRCLNVEVGAQLSHVRLTHWDEQDLRFRFAQLDEIQFATARRLEPVQASDALAWSHNNALVARARLIDREGTLLGFDIADSNWPLDPSFVVFVRNLVEMARGPLGPQSRTIRTGQTLTLQVPSDVVSVQMIEPDGSRVEFDAHHGRALLPPVLLAGFYHLSWQGQLPGSSLAAASLLDEVESNPVQRDSLLLVSANRSAREAQPQQQNLNSWLAAASLLCVALVAWRASRAFPSQRGSA